MGLLAAAHYQISYLRPASSAVGQPTSRACGAASGQFGGDYRAVRLYWLASLRARSPLCAAPIFPSCPPLRARVAQLFGIIPASLVTQVAVGDVNSVQRATRGSVNCWRLDGWAKAYISKRCRWHCACSLRLTPEVPLTTMSGHHTGSVDCWLCQNIHQIFGGSPAGYPRLRVESAWASSS